MVAGSTGQCHFRVLGDCPEHLQNLLGSAQGFSSRVALVVEDSGLAVGSLVSVECPSDDVGCSNFLVSGVISHLGPEDGVVLQGGIIWGLCELLGRVKLAGDFGCACH